MRVLNIWETRKTRGGLLYPGGLITGCIFLLTGRWAYNRGGLISGRAYKRQFTVWMKCFHPRETRTDEFIPAWDEILLRPILTPDKNSVFLVIISFQEEID